MCTACSDFVDVCPVCPPSGRRKTGRLFFLPDSLFCEHLTAKHGTDDPSHYAHFAWGDHTGDDCECRTGNWWGGRPDPIGMWEED